LGHFLVGRTAWESIRLDKVVYLPCAHSPLKSLQPKASAKERLSWLKTGLLGQKWAQVSDWEIQRSGVSYSVDTAAYWKKHVPHGALFWIMGSDQWIALPQWKDFRRLSQWVHFLVFPRPESPKPRRGIRMTILPLRFDLSSTEIRQRVLRGLSIRGMVLENLEKRVGESRSYR
jgi:nicotinate-nucleotide adenylyltransferase